MYKFEKEKRTLFGGTEGVVDIVTGTYCDFCGSEHTEDYDTMFTYEVKDIGGSEEYYYYMQMPSNLVDIRAFDFFQVHDKYHFCDGEDAQGECSMQAILNNTENCNVASAFAEARLKAIEKMENVSNLITDQIR